MIELQKYMNNFAINNKLSGSDHMLTLNMNKFINIDENECLEKELYKIIIKTFPFLR